MSLVTHQFTMNVVPVKDPTNVLPGQKTYSQNDDASLEKPKTLLNWVLIVLEKLCIFSKLASLAFPWSQDSDIH